jgi:predicted AAA+ superfamily ATPase
MNRRLLGDMARWLERSRRKPLVLRGARQVGKTWAVRELARRADLELVELNFEEHPEYAAVFDNNSPTIVITEIERLFARRITPDRTLLFLDEIQRAPQAFANLRWFYEKMPEMAVVATGSLLDFVLADHAFSMPVGRISYLFMEPLSFEEFVEAKGEDQLLAYLSTEGLGAPSAPVHDKLMRLYREYTVIGGMPDAIMEWLDTRSVVAAAEVHQNLIRTYREDFNKYPSRLESGAIEKVMAAVPRLLGQKIKYSNIDRELRAAPLKRSLELLTMARVCHMVRHTSGNGIPLAAEESRRTFKAIMLDTGLVSSMQGIVLETDAEIDKLIRVNAGGIAEQAVGQMLRSTAEPFMDPVLHYYNREKPGSEAELDYLLAFGSSVVPLEVKAGATGSLKSLHYFMHRRQLPLAVRVNAEIASVTPVDVRLASGESARYTLLSIPFYLTGQVKRLLREVSG